MVVNHHEIDHSDLNDSYLSHKNNYFYLYIGVKDDI